MKVRVVRQPTGTLEGLSLDKYRVGGVYDLPPTIAAYLVAEGCAEVEMRTTTEPKPPPPGIDRRRKRWRAGS